MVIGKTKKDDQDVVEKQKKIIKKYDWKDFNKDKYSKLLDIKESGELIDRKKWNLREKEMLNNILKNANKKGVALVITGSGHISFFRKKIKEGIFPFN